MRRAVQLVLIVAVGLLLGLLSGPAQAAEGGLRLEVSPTSDRFAPDQPVTLRMTVTNQGAEPCQLAATATGTVHLTSVTRDGETVAPTFARSSFIDGFAGAVRSSLKTVRPGESVTFDLTGDQDTLSTQDPTPGGGAISAVWKLDGEHDVTASYRVPAVGGQEANICAGSSNAATAAFEVGLGFDWLRWLLIGGAALVVVLLVVVVFLLVRRRRRRAVAAVLLLVAAMIGIDVGDATPAEASIELPPKPHLVWPKGWNKAKYDKWEAALFSCTTRFQTEPGGDPAGIMKDIVSIDKPSVFITPTEEDSISRNIKPPSSTSFIDWNMDGTRRNAGDGVMLNECSSLYHELYHAWRNFDDKLSIRLCGDIERDEVEATFVENEYRRRHVKDAKGKPIFRKFYAGMPLPKSLADCKDTSSQKCLGLPSQLAGEPLVTLNGARRAAREECPNADNTASSNGDPHLTTFDQHNYDFQAVGEFVSAKSGTDFEVQTRQSPVPGVTDRSVSMNTAVAVRVGKDKVGVYVEDGDFVVRVNGKVEKMARGSLPLPDGGTLIRREPFQEYLPDGYALAWPDGSVAAVESVGDWGLKLLLSVADERKRTLTGLLGDLDGNKENDLKTRSGDAISATPDHKELYGKFGDSWRLSQDESLFTYPAGKNTQSFTDRSYPDRLLTVAGLTEEERKRAAVACELAGITDPGLFDQCLLDVARTGQPAFATSTAVLQDYLPATEEPKPDPADKVIRDGDVVTGSIDKKGERDVFQLDLGDATEFQFVDQTGDIAIEAAVPGSWLPALTTDAFEVGGTSKEHRQIVVSRPDEGTGEYSFRFVTNKQRRTDVKMGDKIEGKIDVPGQVDVYALDAAGVSSILLVDPKGCDYWVGIAEDKKDSSVPTPYPVWSGMPDVPDGACATIPIDLDPDKRFLLVAWSKEAKTFDYEFRIQKTP